MEQEKLSACNFKDNSADLRKSSDLQKENQKSLFMSIAILGFFVLLYILGYQIPLSGIFQINTYSGRMNIWIDTVMAIAAFICILLKRNVSRNAFVFSISCALAYLASLVFTYGANHLAWAHVGRKCVTLLLTGYVAFLLFETNLTKNKTANLGGWKLVKSFAGGVLIGLPLAVGNALFFILSDESTGILLQWDAFASSFEPAIYEEVLFRMFLYGLCMQFTKGRSTSKLQSLCVAAVTILPWAFLHYVDDFRYSFIYPTAMTLVIAVFFGLPYYFILRKKNIYMCFGFHWITDFIRFFLGY